MSSQILRGKPAPGKSAGFPHDPDICSLDPSSGCDACRAGYLQKELAFFERDAEARERSRLRVIGERFAEATGIQLADLAVALLPIMAKPTVEIICAVLDERGAT